MVKINKAFFLSKIYKFKENKYLELGGYIFLFYFKKSTIYYIGHEGRLW